MVTSINLRKGAVVAKHTSALELRDRLQEEITQLSDALDEQDAARHPGAGSTRGAARARAGRQRPGPEFYSMIGSEPQPPLVIRILLLPVRLAQWVVAALVALVGLPAEWRRSRRAREQVRQYEQRRQQVMALSALSRESLSTRLKRLQQFDRWLAEDPELTTLIDSTLKHRADGAARRQATLTLVVAVVSLVAGWLLNTLNPGTLLAGLLPH
jgi:hypothetical protein